MKLPREVIDLAYRVNRALKSLGWRWEPERGDWFIGGGRLYLVTDIREKAKICDDTYGLEIEADEVTPFLHWEKIEKILEDAGYNVIVYKGVCEIWKEDASGMRLVFRKKDSTRQKAVMKSVIEITKRNLGRVEKEILGG